MMKSLLKLVLLSAVVLLASTQMSSDYDKLNSEIQTHVNKAITEANQKFGNLQKHIKFHTLNRNRVTSLNYYIRMTLKTTVCSPARSEDEYKLKQGCNLKGDLGTPWFDCVVCRKKVGGADHVECALYRDKKKRDALEHSCDLYFTGGQTGMLKANNNNNDKNNQEFGCVGCV